MTHKNHLSRLLNKNKYQAFLLELLEATEQNGQKELNEQITLQSEIFHKNESKKKKGFISEVEHYRILSQLKKEFSLLLKQYKEAGKYISGTFFHELQESNISQLNPSSLTIFDKENLAFQDNKGKHFKLNIHDTANIRHLLNFQPEVLFNLRETDFDFFDRLSHTNRDLFAPSAGAEPEFEIESAEKSIDISSPSTQKGVLLRSIPTKMQIDNLHRCIIRVAFDKETILVDLPSLLDNVVIKENIRITSEMEVTFNKNDHFEIDALNKTVQIVERESATEWNFDVRPINLGKYPLTFKVSIILPNGVKEMILTESVMVVTEAVDTAMEFKPAELQVLNPELEAFKTILHKILDDKGFLGVNEVLQSIEKSHFDFVKSTLANLREQLTNTLTQLAPNHFIIGLRAFIDTISV